MVENNTQLKTQAIMQKPSRFPWAASVLVVLLIVIAAGVYTWYALSGSCEVSAVEETSTILLSLVKRYDDVYQSATAATQTSVVVPVAVMQQLLMDTQQVAVPACMKTAKTELLNYMKTVIRAFWAYSAQEANIIVRGLIEQSETHYANFSAELKAVKKCAPLCIR
jgi:hypothetical protein